MSKFKVGDDVTLVLSPKWVSLNQEHPFGPLPKFGEIYTVAGYDSPFRGLNFVLLKECHSNDSFDERIFEKVISTPMLYRAIEHITQTI